MAAKYFSDAITRNMLLQQPKIWWDVCTGSGCIKFWASFLQKLRPGDHFDGFLETKLRVYINGHPVVHLYLTSVNLRGETEIIGQNI